MRTSPAPEAPEAECPTTATPSARSVRSEQSKEIAVPSRHWPIFVGLTFSICTVVLILEFYRNGQDFSPESPPTEDCHYRCSISSVVFCAATLAQNPLFGPSAEVLVRMGASLATLTVGKQEVWRLVTPMYLHGGVVHYVLNMVVLLQFGIEMERNYGFLRVGAVYMLSGIFGVVASAALAPHTVSVGASGAIFGLFGACLGQVLQNWGLYKRPCLALLQLLLGAALQLLLGTMPMLDNFAHFFGFLMGFLCSLVLFVLRRQTTSGRGVATRPHQHLLQFAAGLSAAALLLIGLAVLFGPADANELCPWCDKISCLPFPWGCDPEAQGSCWGWDCRAAELAGCSGQAAWTGSPQNGTVVLRCPEMERSRQVTVQPVDVTTWDIPALTSLCRDHCM